ncbi:isoleucine--tRNA ligase [Candidatus Peregrinibacteria bacterium]|nr:MAG: isoleucine--tRNA ligase [Candidatus Peregrinibacteria bacterium]
MFQKINNQQSFPQLEEQILAFWEKTDAFQKSIDLRLGNENFVFFDGPPFATGLPHYGHIIGATLKDIFPRYKTMQGFYVERKFGWDCHGLPVENLIEKELGLADKQAIEDYGVDTFNEKCRDSVLRYEHEWEYFVNRMGRWVDFKNNYKTMNPEYMESTWWVFKSLWNKNRVYQAQKPMHICPRCETPLSNFEVNQPGAYQEINDISATVKFKVHNKENTFILAWTTTPWTLPGNTLLAVNPEVTYASLSNGSQTIIIAEDLLENYEKALEGYEKINTFSGQDMIDENWTYKPLFQTYKETENAFRVVAADFVTTESGTGIVHIAPAFGEDDLNLGKIEKVEFLQHIGMNGYFKKHIFEECKNLIDTFEDIPVKAKDHNRDFDKNMIQVLQKQDQLFERKDMLHSYPHCWRCDTPLLNYATDSWFVKVEDMREKLLKNNDEINWTPKHIQKGRFGKWLEGARDWAISRNRFWGTPLPVWINDISEKQICMGSIKELEDFSGKTVCDLHKHHVDQITFTIEGEEGTYKRISEVFDCWFESGSMPYASRHYPFSENISLKNEMYFARHGHAENNRLKVYSCSLESASKHPLTEQGRKEVTTAAQESNIQFDYIVTSPLLRTTETAKIYQEICGGEIIEDNRLIERNAGEFDGCERSAATSWSTQQHDIWTARPEGGETYEEIQKRTLDIINEYNTTHEGKNILFVSHACTIKLALQKFQTEKRLNTFPKIPNAKLLKIQNNFKFPADFIAEGLDQTRGWFYVLTVLSTSLFDTPAFKNVIVNGTILAEDGKEMSKRLKNYPSPKIIFDKHGADAMRFYLMNSPCVHGEPLSFAEKGVGEVVRKILLPIWNAVSFLTTYANADKWTPKNLDAVYKTSKDSKNQLDIWMLSELEILKNSFTKEMDNYNMQKAASLIYPFLDNMTNWYIRRSRRRFWEKNNQSDNSDKTAAYSTLFVTLYELIHILAPICPFITESIYKTLTESLEDNLPASLHHCDWIQPETSRIHTDISYEIANVQKIISLGLRLRKQENIRVRQPLLSLSIACNENVHLEKYKEIIKEELNIKEIIIIENPEDIATKNIKPNARLLGKRLGKKMQPIIIAAKQGNYSMDDNGNVMIEGESFSPEEIEIVYEGKEGLNVLADSDIIVSLNIHITPELAQEGKAREILRHIQDMRKSADYNVSDRIIVDISGDEDLMNNFGEYICSETLSTPGTIEKADQEKEAEGMVIKIFRK